MYSDCLDTRSKPIATGISTASVELSWRAPINAKPGVRYRGYVPKQFTPGYPAMA
jgi:hypothetical protein